MTAGIRLAHEELHLRDASPTSTSEQGAAFKAKVGDRIVDARFLTSAENANPIVLTGAAGAAGLALINSAGSTGGFADPRRLAKDWECLNRSGLAPEKGVRPPHARKILSAHSKSRIASERRFAGAATREAIPEERR